MDPIAQLAIALLVVAAAACLVRVVRAEQLTDKAVALDVVTSTIVCGLAVTMARGGDGSGVLTEMVLALSLVGFLATVAIARYVGRRGA